MVVLPSAADAAKSSATHRGSGVLRLGLQIPNFSYGAPVSELYPAVVAQAQEAEAAGFDAVLLMDHFYQLPHLGALEDPMLEAYTALGGLATTTRRVRLGTLVTGNTYRNPALLAKSVTTLDVMSGGRGFLGIGAGWFELEHRQLGFEFGTFTDRFERLEEALQIIPPMLRGERPTFEGRWYHAESVLNNPRIRDDMPILIGGSGEQKTFALAARYADHLNVIAPFDRLPGKVEALMRRCQEHDRDPVTLETSALITVVVTDAAGASEAFAPNSRVAVGNLNDIAEQIKRYVIDVGISGVVVNLPSHGYTPGLITDVGEVLAPVVGM
ncbi:LLM class F420-dependent oxidoreductase [Mycobacterium seoulense]|uniref:LLM class F420-dependent oxidoreductase n=1 Tax=Mycobacterium seoulense TaxID=386911 RepID=A0A7I7P414_9MYCO|nr:MULTISPECIES: LLM class F420-dependent oxidoreductase [Mycobacterium]MCV7437496.1 LLM class F420-dependent oxidoreductase [Mycobacterium seoulense]BBY02498.1 LLM class F420-dependent oxidoreductase [Mycobacterium seoulense]